MPFSFHVYISRGFLFLSLKDYYILFHRVNNNNRNFTNELVFNYIIKKKTKINYGNVDRSEIYL